MSAPLKQVHRSLFHGRTMRLRCTITRDGAPMDLSSAKFRLTAKRDVKDADVDAVFHVDTATVSDPTTGIAEIDIPKEATDLIAVGDDPEELVYDIVIEDADSGTYTLENGILTVYPSPTRAEELT